MNKALPNLQTRLAKARTEEDVKAAWAQCFELPYNTSDDHDLYTPQVLFEFKFDTAITISNAQAGSSAAPTPNAVVVAQVMYYLRRLKFGIADKGIPAQFCIADKHGAAIGQTAQWKTVFSDEGGLYDWDLRPSSPDPVLVQAIRQHPAFAALSALRLGIAQEAELLIGQLRSAFDAQGELAFGDKKQITETNFEDVFEYWNTVFGEAVRNGFKSSRYFVADIQLGKTQVVASEGKVYFQVGPEDVRIKKILAQDYDRFWRLYEKVTHAPTVRGILAKIDRLTDEVARRKHGEFFTPLAFAQKALQYLDKELGADWASSGEYRIWDMAAGTGNLEYHLPTAALPYTYLSTLYKEDVEHCQRLFPGASTFQYDYLNDDVGNVFAGSEGRNGQLGLGLPADATWTMPAVLRKDLANSKLKWVILINPPFATAQQGGTMGSNKADVANTKIRSKMHDHDLGEVSRELFSQFLFRIKKEFENKVAHLAIFAPLKYVNANNDQKLRDQIFQFQYRKGFIFSSEHFQGTSSSKSFPVGCLLWNLSKAKKLDAQQINVDVFETSLEKTGKKRFVSENRKIFLSKWVQRPRTTRVMPPVSSAINLKLKGPDIRDRVSDGFLGSLMCAGNDIQHQGATALLSAPYGSAGSHSITAVIFEQSLVVHAVRRIPKATWHNDRDQFLQPSTPPNVAFVLDCVVWSLFANSNATVAMRDVAYDGRTYQIENHFFPVLLSELVQWPMGDMDIAQQLPTAQDRFVATWLSQQQQQNALSDEAKALLRAGTVVYKLYFAQLNQLRTSTFKIDTWDAGWWQIRNALDDVKLGNEALEALKLAHNALKAKLLPQIYEYGFLIE